MNIEQLRSFLLYSGREGYAHITEDAMKKEQDGSTSIVLEKDNWKFHDNYFGGEPYGGREVVFYEHKPVWIMVYYGNVDASLSDLAPVYGFLKKALALVPDEAPYRGPAVFIEDDFRYENKWNGSLDDFSGEEIIYLENRKIYSARYGGGLVARR